MYAHSLKRTALTAIFLIAALGMGAVSAQDIQVLDAYPSSAPQGATDLDITVSGSGFEAGMTVEFVRRGTNGDSRASECARETSRRCKSASCAATGGAHLV